MDKVVFKIWAVMWTLAVIAQNVYFAIIVEYNIGDFIFGICELAIVPLVYYTFFKEKEQ